jgi:hypothetical protein
VAYANTAFTMSHISTGFRLIYKGEAIDYTDVGTAGINQLIAASDGKIDEAHPLRTALRGDLVSLAIQADAGDAFGMSDEAVSFADQALNVAGINLRLKNLAHECAHNMGCVHDRDEMNCVNDCSSRCEGVFPYSFGYIFPYQSKTYKTIMSYGQSSDIGIQYFSNPDVNYPNQQTGVPTGIDYQQDPCDSADNATTINNTRDTVAQFRKYANATNTTLRTSITSGAAQATGGDSVAPGISDDGRYVVFASAATNFFGGDNNGSSDIFIHDRELGTVQVRSGNAATVANDDSHSPAISGNGQFVVFTSDASNLLSGGQDTNGVSDIYGEKLTRVSVSTSGTQGNFASTNPSISKTGRFVAFESDATTLDDNSLDTNSARDIFVRDRDKNNDYIFDQPGSANVETIRLMDSSGSFQTNSSSFNPAISADGIWIAFESDATNLLSAGQDTNAKRDIYIRNRVTGATIRASVGPSNLQSDGHSYGASISHDGRLVAFHSEGTNLLGSGNDTNAKTDIFIYDRVAGTTICASRETGATGTLGNGHSYEATATKPRSRLRASTSLSPAMQPTSNRPTTAWRMSSSVRSAITPPRA